MTAGNTAFGANQAAKLEQAQQIASSFDNCNTAFGANQAAKLKQVQQMASFLNNQANATIQKNTTIKNLVATNATLTKAIVNIQLLIAQMCAADVPTSPAPMTLPH